jgi:hypothetical protein
MMKSPHAALAAVLLALAACGTNPVTGKREIQFVSTGQEISIGQQNYAPMRQSEGLRRAPRTHRVRERGGPEAGGCG